MVPLAIYLEKVENYSIMIFKPRFGTLIVLKKEDSKENNKYI